MSEVPAPSSRRTGVGFWMLLLLLCVLAAWRGWHWWREHDLRARAAANDTTQQVQALAQRIDHLRIDLRAQSQRLQQADATNRVLRDELLGLGQRAALLEDSVRTLAEPVRHGAQVLRLDEVELLLAQGQQRLQLAGDLAGARHAYALASDVLEGVDDPAILNLRQALVQERAALDAVGADPRASAARGLDAFAAHLILSPASSARGRDDAQPWWRRAFARLVAVQRSERALAIGTGERAAAYATLQLDLGLARMAVERRDQAAYVAALDRADHGLGRLWSGARLQDYRRQLRALRALSLQVRVPTLGSTRQQLRALRATR